MTPRIQPVDFNYCKRLTSSVCRISGQRSLITDLYNDLSQEGIITAVCNHDTATLFSWLIRIFNYQGISDQVAMSYMDRHGTPQLKDLNASLSGRLRCQLLQGYWHFTSCGYRKSTACCTHQRLLPSCPLPRHAFRNGRLNQTAFSLALFIRDVAQGDLISWLQHRIRRVTRHHETIYSALIEPLSQIHGVSDKVIRLALSDLLLGVGRFRQWRDIGAKIVVVDSLVHNFLQRTGILSRLNANHGYGPQCYQTGGCVDVLHLLSTFIDARSFNRDFPSYFPRFVQKAIWNYCASSEFNICNGNQIADGRRCQNRYCSLYQICDRVRLSKQVQ